MTGIIKNQKLPEVIELLSGAMGKFEPELLKSFVTYWVVRKMHPSISATELNELKKSLSSVWIKLIESNHKFRELYGEDKANELINKIEENKRK